MLWLTAFEFHNSVLALLSPYFGWVAYNYTLIKFVN